MDVVPLEEPARDPSVELATAASAAHELVAELRSMFAEVLDRLDRERRERIDDVGLTTELITEGWRTVDRRLGRLEKIVERLDRYEYFERQGTDSGATAEIRRLDDVRRSGA